MMAYRDQMFQLVLGDCSFDQIRAAFVEHVKRKSELPTPSDIYNRIHPPAQPLSPAFYVAIRKRMGEGNVFITQEERDYCRAFERAELAKVAGGTPELKQAQAEIAQHLRLTHDNGDS